MTVSTVSYYFVVETHQEEARKQAQNIVPGYCPDYWTKGFDGKGDVVCKNGFTGTTNEGQKVTYKFVSDDKPVPESIVLNDITTHTNTNKCNTYGNPINFPTPWLEMRAKCDVVTF
jgi:hypothetical protein